MPRVCFWPSGLGALISFIFGSEARRISERGTVDMGLMPGLLQAYDVHLQASGLGDLVYYAIPKKETHTQRP